MIKITNTDIQYIAISMTIFGILIGLYYVIKITIKHVKKVLHK